MQDVISLLGLLLIWIGVVFSALGVAGMLRLPDVYCRLHASGKVSTLGLCGLLLGTALLMPASTLKVLALAIFMVLSAPVASHAIALAAYRLGIPLRRKVRDDLGGHFGDAADA
jgi:multicomponent Na+:H+ antiporter subunit G